MLTKDSTSYNTSTVNVRDSHGVGEGRSRRSLRRRDFSLAFIARFHTKYTKAAGCWLWQAGTFAKGYGMVNVGRDEYGTQHTEYAHRVMYVLAKGDITAGLGVMHSCDTPGCVNPDHLSLGTQADNLQDASRKGRLRHRERVVGSVRWLRDQRRRSA